MFIENQYTSSSLKSDSILYYFICECYEQSCDAVNFNYLGERFRFAWDHIVFYTHKNNSSCEIIVAQQAFPNVFKSLLPMWYFAYDECKQFYALIDAFNMELA